jgi:hypothetical protein
VRRDDAARPAGSACAHAEALTPMSTTKQEPQE